MDPKFYKLLVKIFGDVHPGWIAVTLLCALAIYLLSKS